MQPEYLMREFKDKRDLAIAKAQQLPLKLKQKQDRLNQLMSAELPQLEMSLFSEITEYCKVSAPLIGHSIDIFMKRFCVRWQRLLSNSSKNFSVNMNWKRIWP
jgi:hypothetical protein